VDICGHVEFLGKHLTHMICMFQAEAEQGGADFFWQLSQWKQVFFFDLFSAMIFFFALFVDGFTV
jgi:hypothetical protein